MEKKTRGSEAAIAEMLKLSRGISVKEMSKLADVAKTAGGLLVAVDGDDDWCGNGRFRFKWPPKKEEFVKFLDVLVNLHIDFETLINGTPKPDEVVINASRINGFRY